MVTSISKSASSLLNLMRWLSAFLVLAHHLRTNYFVAYSELESHSLLIKAFYLITFLGHNAVIVFFVLSGFFVGGNFFVKYKTNTYSLKEYFTKRLTRLYIVLLPALVISCVLGFGVYYNYGEISSTFDYKDFRGSLFFLQTIYTVPFAGNEPLWSLAYEFWYYILFPIIILFLYERKIIYLLFLISISLFVSFDILLYFTIWLIGVFFFLYKKRILNLFISSMLFIFIFIGYRIITIDNKLFFLNESFIGDFILSISVGLLVNSIIHSNIKIYYYKTNKLLADFSYSLYLLHVPVLYSILSFINKADVVDIKSLSLFIFIFLIILLFSYIVSLYTEKQTSKISKFLLNKFSEKEAIL